MWSVYEDGEVMGVGGEAVGGEEGKEEGKMRCRGGELMGKGRSEEMGSIVGMDWEDGEGEGVEGENGVEVDIEREFNGRGRREGS